jgi:hypothetical protein
LLVLYSNHTSVSIPPFSDSHFPSLLLPILFLFPSPFLPSFLSLHYFKTFSSYSFLISFVSFIPLSLLLLSLIVFLVPFIYVFHNPPPPLLPFL